MARRFPLVALALTLFACTESTPKAQPPSHDVTDASANVVSRTFGVATVLDASAPPVTLPESKPGWKSVPKEQNGFYAVLDGLCSKLGATHIGSDLVIHYGGFSMFATERTGDASFIAMRGSSFESLGEPTVASPTGIAGRSLDDFWLADSTGTRSSAGAQLYRRVNGTWKKYEKDETNIHAWLDGGVIGTGGFAVSNGEVWSEGSPTKPPAALGAGLAPFPQLSAFPTGEVTLLGLPADANGAAVENTVWLARHWSPTKKLTQLSLPFFPSGDYPRFVEFAPDELYAFNGNTVAEYDGTAWKVVAKSSMPKRISSVTRAAKDEVWAFHEEGAVERSTPTGFVRVAMPEPVLAVSGLDVGAPWAVGVSGKLYKRVNDAWTEVKMPAPAFGTSSAVKPKGVYVAAADDVTVLSAYWEKGLGWTEPELHWLLLRTKAPTETMRCNEPDPENNNAFIGRGFQSWPPLATSECTTPFTVLARRSNANKKPPADTDWKAIRAALKGHADLAADGKLVEFKSGDRTFLGAKAKDVESGKKIATLAAAKDRLRPEVVCGEPPATTREIPIE